MTMADGWVVAGSIGFLAAFYGWFFWSKRPQRVAAPIQAGVQRVAITVKGGFVPDVVTVRPGLPVHLDFRRDESGDCTDRVVIPEFRINQALPAYATTGVDFTPMQPGTYEFACGMGMIHGQIVVAG